MCQVRRQQQQRGCFVLLQRGDGQHVRYGAIAVFR
jgi:hypothetical protein